MREETTGGDERGTITIRGIREGDERGGTDVNKGRGAGGGGGEQGKRTSVEWRRTGGVVEGGTDGRVMRAGGLGRGRRGGTEGRGRRWNCREWGRRTQPLPRGGEGGT